MVLGSTLPGIILFDHTMKEETSISGARGLCAEFPAVSPPPQEWGLGAVLLLFGFSKREDFAQRHRLLLVKSSQAVTER